MGNPTEQSGPVTENLQMRSVIKNCLKQTFTPAQIVASRKIYTSVISKLHSTNLTQLAIIYGTDKWNHHWYTQHYQKHFHHLRRKKLNVLEIGIGGYEDPLSGGNSLRMWKHYFPNSNIYGIDINDKSALQENRIKIFQGDQSDETFLRDVFNRIGSLDVVIDDGSHVNAHVITSFKTLFPLLNPGGIYAVEDTEHSYAPKFGGDNEDLGNPSTMMNFFKNLTDGLNHEDLQFFKPGYAPSYFDKNILSIYFYHNLIILYKGTETPARSS